MKNKEYYLEKYDELVKEAIKEADQYYDTFKVPKEKREYGEWICEFEAEANADEVVGYYLETYPNDYLPMWVENTQDIKLTNQDKDVSKILECLWGGEKNGME